MVNCLCSFFLLFLIFKTKLFVVKDFLLSFAGGFRSSSPTNPGQLKSESYDQFGSFREVSVARSSQQMADELSSLPSPRISEVDLDSDKETVETDVLLSSYHEDRKGI